MGLGVARANRETSVARAGVATVIKAEGIQSLQMRPRKSEAGFATIDPPSQADFLFCWQMQPKQGGTTGELALVPIRMGAFCFNTAITGA
jgi:hypothetical protein